MTAALALAAESPPLVLSVQGLKQFEGWFIGSDDDVKEDGTVNFCKLEDGRVVTYRQWISSSEQEARRLAEERGWQYLGFGEYDHAERVRERIRNDPRFLDISYVKEPYQLMQGSDGSPSGKGERWPFKQSRGGRKRSRWGRPR
jgi:hypothetical protein